MTGPELRPARSATESAAVVHLFCCDPDRAFCGTDISRDLECTVVPAGVAYCVVCTDLNGPQRTCTCTTDQGPEQGDRG